MLGERNGGDFFSSIFAVATAIDAADRPVVRTGSWVCLVKGEISPDSLTLFFLLLFAAPTQISMLRIHCISYQLLG